MHPAAHTMPIYLLGSLQYFADVRAANAGAIPSASKPEATITTPEDTRFAAGNGNPAASGVGGGEGGVEQ